MHEFTATTHCDFYEFMATTHCDCTARLHSDCWRTHPHVMFTVRQSFKFNLYAYKTNILTSFCRCRIEEGVFICTHKKIFAIGSAHSLYFCCVGIENSNKIVHAPRLSALQNLRECLMLSIEKSLSQHLGAHGRTVWQCAVGMCRLMH